MRRYRALAAMTAEMMLLGSAALADIVYNDIDDEASALDAEVESTVMKVGDADGTVGLYMHVRNGGPRTTPKLDQGSVVSRAAT